MDKYYHYSIYAIILIGGHRTAEPFMLFIRCHYQYSYQRYYFRSLIGYISYLPKLRRKHRVFVITIKKCKYALLKLGLLWFDISH